MDNHLPVADIQDFKGLFDRGEPLKVPDDHASELLNMVHPHQTVATREGSTRSLSVSHASRIFIYKKSGEVARTLFLNLGSIYDSVNTSVPILTVSGMTDFSAINLYDRVYISPHDGTEGLSGEFVYVYDGTTCRKAAGVPPTGFTMVATTSSTDGKLDIGTHLFAVVFETPSGHLTKPGPETYPVYSAPGGKKVDISSIGAGPAGTVARVLLSTKAIPVYSGNPNDYEFFKVPDGRLANNSGATLTLDFYDADLIESADDLFDLLSEIPAGVGFLEFNGKLLTWGEDGNSGYIRISLTSQPEAFSDVDGFLSTDRREVGGIKSCFVFRNNLFTNKAYQTYVTSDNGSTPDTWTILDVDKGVGSSIFGIATINESKGATTDKVLVASRSGLWLFTGLFSDFPLTWKVDGIWQRINKTYFDKVQVVQDPTNTRIYVTIPLDNATEPSHILLGDYGGGLTVTDIVWSLWEFPWKPTSISAYVDSSTLKARLFIGSSDGNVYYIDDTVVLDDNTAIDWTYKTAYFSAIGGQVGHFNLMRFTASGTGNISIDLYGLHDSNHVSLAVQAITTSPGVDYVRKFNHSNERLAVKFSSTTSGNKIDLQRLLVYGKSLWVSRPY